jgi:hypothetical protein
LGKTRKCICGMSFSDAKSFEMHQRKCPKVNPPQVKTRQEVKKKEETPVS